MTGVAEIFVGLLLAVTVLALVARKLTIPYPILFVVGGLLLGLIPKLPKVRLDPELVFLFVLRPCCTPRRCSPPGAISGRTSVPSHYSPSASSCSQRFRSPISRTISWRSEEHTSELQSLRH